MCVLGLPFSYNLWVSASITVGLHHMWALPTTVCMQLQPAYKCLLLQTDLHPTRDFDISITFPRSQPFFLHQGIECFRLHSHRSLYQTPVICS
ncbi:hypothetical protein AB205_0015610 [Aquarana catesbeiana]|uniref:Uncharacterized protein n=1 Tax=Aquarana catesbeiana TaxID=8400 RepID=A0A2G9S4D2_AQUCT|nr:hypothetical protein AB205_0015610 [Aquarana catesbeiana]